MVKMLVICDFCNNPLPIEEGDLVRTFQTKEWNTKSLFPHLCENCAERIDRVLREFKNSTTQECLTAQYYARLNVERRKQIGTEG